ncbi:rRNA maturation RNase YbeY [Candidatus Falkowbacteria bacterium HGW-Falkowbacteria-2]|uniref:Endoribonuclease YbeY n=1 Tax=Candidatus Falkowbacteria bacterium HGW-Falkowbacteria-2 TaxID=2013769 RepID=A0A2N2DXA1_9BACT|nr:MAG: rRNA maturation RNase YbeY [Candidatus Falkowbacteria bacterium HGW-Falkowbacteria-2]
MFSIDITNFTAQRLPQKLVIKAATYAAKKLRLQGELSLVLAGDKRLHTLNRDYRGKDKPTDILTFPGSLGALGEIFINLNDCRRPQKYIEVFGGKKSFEYILIFLLLHGLLHLSGLDDEKENERLAMITAGEKMMKELVKNGIMKAEK